MLIFLCHLINFGLLALVTTWPSNIAVCMSYKFGHQMAPLALVPNLAVTPLHGRFLAISIENVRFFPSDLYLPDWVTTKRIHHCQITWSPSLKTRWFLLLNRCLWHYCQKEESSKVPRLADRNQASEPPETFFLTLSWHPNTPLGERKQKKIKSGTSSKRVLYQKMCWKRMKEYSFNQESARILVLARSRENWLTFFSLDIETFNLCFSFFFSKHENNNL